MEDITAAATNGTFLFQLYVNKDRSASEKLLQQAEAAGVKAVIVTIDQPTPPKREADERVKVDSANLNATPNGAKASNDSRGSGLGRTMAGFMDGSLNWDDIRWLRRCTKLPLVLKGVLTVADAVKAADYGLDGILISNHGGRSLDTSTPSILALVEMRKTCPEIFDRLEVYLDGGVCRGTDMFKALCLGARAVGMGRAFLYAANYGVEGIEHLIFSTSNYHHHLSG
jgi:L-lactate dehydrogenase (cytochrome)